MSTGIEWTDETWNPVTGCMKVSPGCKNCYAESVANRFFGKQYPPVEYVDGDGTNLRPRKFTDVMCHEDRLEQPLHWRAPRKVFVNSMSDLFHEDVPFWFVDRVFMIMALSPRHTFQILTKRPERMREYLTAACSWDDALSSSAEAHGFDDDTACRVANAINGVLGEGFNVGWPMKNVWLGVSVENQEYAVKRIPLLLRTPAAKRFISYEPALGELDLATASVDVEKGIGILRPKLDWVIVGGESGPGARPFDIAWARSVVEQCKAAGVACFVKQLGAKPFRSFEVGVDSESLLVEGEDPSGVTLQMALDSRKGGDMDEWPEDLRVREFPA